jgi:hypothetical protein
MMRRVVWGARVTCGGTRKSTKFRYFKVNVRDHLEGLAVDSGNIKMDLENV